MEMRPIVVDGNHYYPTKERLRFLRSEGHLYNLETTVNKEGQMFIAEAKLTILSGARQGTYVAHAQEMIDLQDKINSRNALENAETSAVGRVLGFAGIGIEGGIASYEDMVRATKVSNLEKGGQALVDAMKAIELKNPTPAEPVPAYYAPPADAAVLSSNALPEVLIPVIETGDLDHYLLSMPFLEFRAAMMKNKVPHAARLKNDSPATRSHFINKLKEMSREMRPEDSINPVEKEEEDSAADIAKELIPEPIAVEESAPPAPPIIDVAPEPTIIPTGNQHGVEVPPSPRNTKDVHMLWRGIEKVMTWDALEKKAEALGLVKKYGKMDDLFREATTDEFNEILNS